MTISQCAFHCATAVTLVAIRPTGKVGRRPQDKSGCGWFGPGDEEVVERLKAKACHVLDEGENPVDGRRYPMCEMN